jgi:uncharacterized protein (TIGR03000 family)
MIPRLLAVLLLAPAIAGAEDIVGFPGFPAAPVVGPVVDGPVMGPVVGPMVGPVLGPTANPYCGYWGPRHWIYDYLPVHDASERYGVSNGYVNRRYDAPNGAKAYSGRSTLEPAVPYSDYLAQQRRLQAAVPAQPAQPAAPAPLTPSADRAILDFSLPTDSARLWLDNQPVEGDGKSRSLQTPPLTPGKEYRFAVKVTWPSSNPFEDSSMEQIVTFRAGDRKTIEIRGKN